ncbi:hypothetical protein BGZ58_007796 [Dissophora ornata]|nr:hypothetical protein BGZ58_007796 [Dissophora ornata]
MIAEHQVFKNNSYKEQEEVAVQLAITLDRLGHYGNGMGLKHLGATWDRSEGSCHNFFKRGLEAILSLEGRFVAWSNPEQRQEHSAKMVDAMTTMYSARVTFGPAQMSTSPLDSTS